MSKINFKQTEIGDGSAALTTRIPEGWESEALENIALFKNGKSSPVRSNKYSYPVFGSNGIIGYANKYNSDDETVIIGRVGSYCGSVCYSKNKCWVTDNAIIGNVKKGNHSEFLYYLLLGLRLNKHRTGSGQPLLNQGILNSLEVTAPKFDEQRAIAKILSDLDEKIELNRQMNKTLESIAQAIFKRWFVEFEFPDKYSKPYKTSGGKMTNSDLDEIPDGWTIKEISDCGEIVCGKTPPTADKDNYGNDLFFITIPDMRGQAFVIKTERKLSNKGASTQNKKELPALTICVSCIATPGLVSLTSAPSYTNQQINSIVCNKILAHSSCTTQC